MTTKAKTIAKILIIVFVLGGVLQIGSALAQSGFFGGAGGQTYEKWLTAYEVNDKFKQELDRLIQEGHRRSDLMIAYEFLYHQYGTFADLEEIVSQKENGPLWAEIFAGYTDKHELFEPRAFDTDYLESLTTGSNVTSDDIMIADRISFVSGDSAEELLSVKLESGQSWNGLATERNILNGSSTLPRVQITQEQMALYGTDTFPEDRVAEAFVLANKIGAEPEAIVAAMKAGSNEAAIMAEALVDKYAPY
jgi:hypothetical protein